MRRTPIVGTAFAVLALMTTACSHTVTALPTYLPAKVETVPYSCNPSDSNDPGYCALQRADYNAFPNLRERQVCPTGYTLVTTGPQPGCWLYPK